MLWVYAFYLFVVAIAASGAAAASAGALTAVAAGESISIRRGAWTGGVVGVAVSLLATVAISTQIENSVVRLLTGGDRPTPYLVAVFLEYYGMLWVVYVAPALIAGLLIWNRSGRLRENRLKCVALSSGIGIAAAVVDSLLGLVEYAALLDISVARLFVVAAVAVVAADVGIRALRRRRASVVMQKEPFNGCP